jgi:membrane-associated phospholipid phosphatase
MLVKSWQHFIQVVALLGLVTFSIFDGAYADEFMEDSANATYNIQTSGSESAWKVTSWIGSNVFFHWILEFLLVNWGLGGNKYWTLFIFYYWFVDGHINFLLKMFYHEARPYAVHLKPAAWTCACDFGKPSGHAQLGLANYWIVFDLVIAGIGFKQAYFPKSDPKPIEAGQKKNYGGYFPISPPATLSNIGKKKFWAWFAGILCVLCVLFVGFSRVVRGVHTWSQVLLGWFWGLNISL